MSAGYGGSWGLSLLPAVALREGGLPPGFMSDGERERE